MSSWDKRLALCLLLVHGIAVNSSPEGNRILLSPLDHSGHVDFHLISGQGFAKKGYDVYMLALDKHKSRIESAGIKPLLHKPIKAIPPHEDPEVEAILERIISSGKEDLSEKLAMSRHFSGRLTEVAEEVLQNEELQDTIEKLQFDMALVDDAPNFRGLVVTAYKHGINFATITPFPNPWSAGVPAMPSVEPHIMGKSTDHMSFMERLKNLFLMIAMTNLAKYTNASPDFLVEKYVLNKPFLTISELHNRAAIYFVNTDPYLLDYPRVSAPNYVLVGALGGKPAASLKPEIEKFVTFAKDGAVVVSFGSVAKKMPPVVISKLLAAFSQLPSYHFLVKHEGVVESTVPINVRIMSWLPQNDLLGHNNTRLLFGHGGHSTQIEALFHGVPAIMAPFCISDQQYNANRFVAKGYGVKLDLIDSSQADIEAALRKVLENTKYSNNIRKAQAIHRALPKADETIAFWIDHVIKHGSDHLRPISMDIPLYKLFMMDIMLVLTLVFVLVSCTCFRCMMFCCRSKTKKAKTE